MQKLSNELIEKFLSGNCTEEEAALVWGYLRDHPDEPLLQREFEEADGVSELPPGYREEMLAFITKKTSGGNGVGVGHRVLPMLKYAVAAAVVFFLVRLWVVEKGVKEAVPVTPGVSVVAETAWIDRDNQGQRDELVALPDGSNVRLSPGARLSYLRGFGSTADRDVRLVGKAFFDVAKNDRRPFILHSDGLDTKVLGTTFDLSASPHSDKIKVRLFTGKVLVSLADEPAGEGGREYTLSPGEELVFSRKSRSVAINGPVRHRAENGVAAARQVHPDSISNWYMFNNQTLAEVFDQLSAIYNTDIDYSPEELRHKYFIGKLERRDSLGETLHDIALLNHLSVISLNGKYIVRKAEALIFCIRDKKCTAGR
ncbi:FecR family protein [Puia sp. P3]|uniref:FecR family protein n=1 Tax=Puia sp. P3 TaxID=3423952 RepID=UPI003D666415